MPKPIAAALMGFTLILAFVLPAAAMNTCTCAKVERLCKVISPAGDIDGLCSYEEVPCTACYCDEALVGDENALECRVVARNLFDFSAVPPAISDPASNDTELAQCNKVETFVTLCPESNSAPSPTPVEASPPIESDSPLFDTESPEPSGGSGSGSTRNPIPTPAESVAPSQTPSQAPSQEPSPTLPSLPSQTPVVDEPSPSIPPLPTNPVSLVESMSPVPRPPSVCQPLDDGEEFNVIVLGAEGSGVYDFDFENSDSWGSIAVCGSARLQSAGINSRGSGCDTNGLVVSEGLTWNTSGMVFAGAASFDSNHPLTSVGGSANLACGQEEFSGQIDCSALTSFYSGINDEYCSMAETATTLRQGSSVVFECPLPAEDEPSVATISTDQIEGANSFLSTGCSSGLIINVVPGSSAGSAADFRNAGQNLNSSSTVWNVCAGVETMSMESISVQGTIIAPGTSLSGRSGNLEGQTFVFAAVSGSAEFHAFPLSLC